jgi:hypothetical protein
MPVAAILKKMRKQAAVYWAPLLDAKGTPILDPHGEKTFAAPVQMLVRWEGAQFWDRKAGLIVEEESKEIVYVGCKVLKGGLFWKGCLKDLPTEKLTNPRALEGTWEITKYAEYPMLNPKKGTLRVAQL